MNYVFKLLTIVYCSLEMNDFHWTDQKYQVKEKAYRKNHDDLI